MTSAQLQQLASNIGIKASAAHGPQTELIRAIRMLRNKGSCYSAEYDCTETGEWRQDCRKLRAVWLR